MSERLARYAEDARDRQKCPLCRASLDECQDEEIVWYPQRLVCRKTMDEVAAARKWAAKHDDAPWHDGTFTSWSEKRNDGHPFHYNDGVRIWVDKTDWNPDDQFLS